MGNTAFGSSDKNEDVDAQLPLHYEASEFFQQDSLMAAVKNGDLQKIKSMLRWDPECVGLSRDSRKNTSLHIAAAYGRVREFEFIDKLQPELLEAVNDVQNTAAHKAAENGHISILRYIANKNPSHIMTKGAMGATPGHLAASKGRLDVVRFLAETHPSALSARDRNGSTLTHYAAQHGHTAIVAWAHSHRPAALMDMDNAYATPAHAAAANGQSCAMEYVIAFGRCVHPPGCDLGEEIYVHQRSASDADIFILPGDYDAVRESQAGR